jgi:hypothetical protein
MLLVVRAPGCILLFGHLDTVLVPRTWTDECETFRIDTLLASYVQYAIQFVIREGGVVLVESLLLIHKPIIAGPIG